MKFSKILFSSLLAISLVTIPSADVLAAPFFPISYRKAWWITVVLSAVGVFGGVNIMAISGQEDQPMVMKLVKNIQNLESCALAGFVCAITVPTTAQFLALYYPYDLTFEAVLVSAHKTLVIMMKNRFCAQPFSNNSAGLLALVTGRYGHVSVRTLMEAQESITHCISELNAFVISMVSLQARVVGDSLFEQQCFEILSIAEKMLGNNMVNYNLLEDLIKHR